MKLGANCIAFIAVIEIPRKQWVQIVDNLAENTLSPNVGIRMASIITIGAMC